MKKTPQTATAADRAFSMMFRTLLLFAVPAGIGFVLGSWIDDRFAIKPYGSLAILACTFIFSWTIVIRMYLRFEKERLAEKDAQEQATKNAQTALQQELKR